jgi:DNA-binding transcriptional LysR family regulator
MPFTLKQLEIFDAVVSHGSALAASKVLNLSQPAVSAAITELEINLGSTLFDRWKKRLVLNERGRTLIPMARLLLTNAEDLEHMFGDEQKEPIGTIRLGASTTLASYIIPEKIAGFVEKYPSIKIKVICHNKAEIVSQVDNFTIDIGVIAGTCNKLDIFCRPWLTDELCVFASPSHPLTQKKKILLNDLLACTWIMREEGSGTREVFLNALPMNRKPLKTALIFNNPEPIKRTVALSQSLGCLSKMAIKREVENGVLHQLHTPFLNMRREYFFLIHQKRQQGPVINSLLTHCIG